MYSITKIIKATGLFGALLLAAITVEAEDSRQAGGISWSFTGSVHIARAYHTATLLPNGMVLAAAGDDVVNAIPQASAEL
jgi:hypothetical protein